MAMWHLTPVERKLSKLEPRRHVTSRLGNTYAAKYGVRDGARVAEGGDAAVLVGLAARRGRDVGRSEELRREMREAAVEEVEVGLGRREGPGEADDGEVARRAATRKSRRKSPVARRAAVPRRAKAVTIYESGEDAAGPTCTYKS